MQVFASISQAAQGELQNEHPVGSGERYSPQLQ